jgi:HEAT repeat protein
VDWGLGARLAGEVKSEFQATTVGRVRELKIPEWLKVKLLGKTRSNSAVSYLETILNHQDSVLRWHVVYALWIIQSELVTKLLIHALNDTDYSVRCIAEDVVENISNSPSVIVIRAILANHKQPLEIKEAAAQLLLKPSSDDLFNFLKRIAEDLEQEFWLRRRAAFDLSRVDPEVGLNLLHQMIKEVYDIPKEVLNIVGIDLKETRSEKSVELLLDILNNYNNPVVLSSAAITLASIGSQKAIDSLLEILGNSEDADDGRVEVAYALRYLPSPSEKVLKASLKILQILRIDDFKLTYNLSILLIQGGDEYFSIGIDKLEEIILNHGLCDFQYFYNPLNDLKILDTKRTVNIIQKILFLQCSVKVQWSYIPIRILGELGGTEAIGLLKHILCNSNDEELRGNAALALHPYSKHNGEEEVFSLLSDCLKDASMFVRQSATMAIAQLGNKDVVNDLLQLLDSEDISDCQVAVQALGVIGDEQAVDPLCEILQREENSDLKNLAIRALIQIGGSRTTTPLMQSLENIQNRDLLREIAISLGKSGNSEVEVIESLFNLLNNNEDPTVRNAAIYALGQVAKSNDISRLINLPPEKSQGVIDAIAAIQSRCGFYNYDIAQSPPPEISIEMQQGGNQYIFPNAKEVQIIEFIDDYNENYNP